MVGHGEFPPGNHHEHSDAPPLPTADQVLAALELPAGWSVEAIGTRERVGTGRDGASATFVDTVVRVRRDFAI